MLREGPVEGVDPPGEWKVLGAFTQPSPGPGQFGAATRAIPACFLWPREPLMGKDCLTNL